MYLVFDIGGTKARIGFSKDGKQLQETQILPTPQSFDKFLDQFVKITKNLQENNRVNILAGGIAGVFDKNQETLINAPNLSGWRNKPIKEKLQDAFRAPVFLENDAALAGLGEALKGAGQNKNIVAFIGVGTGVGGVRVVSGKIDAKVFGFEPGHQIINLDGSELETLVSGAALEKKHNKPAENIQDQSVWEQAAKTLSLGLVNTIVHWSPDILVLGGSLMKNIPLEKITSHINHLLKIFPCPEITLSSLGELSGLYGALEYIHQNNSG